MAKRSQSSGTLAGLSIQELHAELSRRQRGLPALYKSLAKAQAKVSKISRIIETLAGKPISGAVAAPGRRRGRPPMALSIVGGTTAPTRPTVRTRPKNDLSLVETLVKVLKGKTLSVLESCAAVKQAGYKTHAENFRVIVNQTLIKSEKFKKVARGQ